MSTQTSTSSTQPLIIAGGGEHACVVCDAALASGRFVLRGYTDLTGGTLLEKRYNAAYLGGDAKGAKENADAVFVIAIGTAAANQRALGVLEQAGARFASVVHPSAVVAATATVEPGAVVLAGAVVNTGAVLRAHAIINTGAIVEHDVEVGSLTHVSPGAAIGGGTKIGARAVIGLGARVRDHIQIGDGAFVGMGAVVVKSVGASEKVVGVPARPFSPSR